MKSSPMSMPLPQGLLFLKYDVFWNFGTCPFWKNVHFLIFGPYWALFGPYWALFDPYWALFGPIGPYLALTVKQKRDTEPHRGHQRSACKREEQGHCHVEAGNQSWLSAEQNQSEEGSQGQCRMDNGAQG